MIYSGKVLPCEQQAHPIKKKSGFPLADVNPSAKIR